MTKTDLIKDKYYVVKYGSSSYLIQFDGQMNGYCKGYIHEMKSFERTNGSFRFDGDCTPEREAIPLEIYWLESCRKADMFVPMPEKLLEEEIINNYILY